MADIPIPEWLTDAQERKAAEACDHKHTKYQPRDEEFRCPKCDAPSGDWCVDDSPNFDCPLLHVDDSLVCYGKDGKRCPAGHGEGADTFVRRLVKKKGLKPCPHCKATGYVKD